MVHRHAAIPRRALRGGAGGTHTSRLLAGCKPGGVVLDPFSGSGTTGLVAQKAGRRYVGIDLNAEYLDLSLATRLQQGALDIDEATA